MDLIGSEVIFGATTTTTNPLTVGMSPTNVADSLPFKSDGSGRAVFLDPGNADGGLTQDDSFELRRVLELDENDLSARSMTVPDKDGNITFGGNIKQAEVMIRGPYILRKLIITTESVAVRQTYGEQLR